MLNLISQIENAAAGSVTEEVRLLKERRKSLDDVIRFTLGINGLQKSLESVLLLKQPPKDIPRDLLNVLGNISDSVATLPANELAKRLVLVEKSIQEDINTIMGISNQLDILDATSLQDDESVVKTSKLHDLVADFRRRTNTAIILKLHLRKRGATVSESVIPVPTDVLVGQVSKLVVEENKCRERTIKGLKKLDHEIGDLIINPTHPPEIKLYVEELHSQINQNIKHLNEGKDIEKMPYAVEIIQMGESKKKPIVKKKKVTKTKEKSSNKKNIKVKRKKRKGFFRKIINWISSPWSVRWRDLD